MSAKSSTFANDFKPKAQHNAEAGNNIVRGRAEVARRAHNPEVVGSNPAPATKEEKQDIKFCFLLFRV